MLAKVSQIIWNGNSIEWSDIENELGYKLQLYKDEVAEGSPIVVTADTTSYDLTNLMTNGGYYRVEINALGDQIRYLDGSLSEKSSEKLQPNGLKPRVIQNPGLDGYRPSGLAWNVTEKAFKMGPYTYVVYNYTNNAYSAAIIAYDLEKKVVKRWDISNVRYILDLTINDSEENVTFYFEQENHPTRTMNWSVFFIQ